MLVDLDHLLAEPIYQENRCSIQFHPLHTYYAIAIYILMLFFKKPLKIIGIGLLLHMFTDFIDCIMTYLRCKNCLEHSPMHDILVIALDFF